MQHVVSLLEEKFYSNTVEQQKYVNLGNLFGNFLIHTQNRMERSRKKKPYNINKGLCLFKTNKIQEVQSAALFIPKTREKKMLNSIQKLLYWFCKRAFRYIRGEIN